MKGRYFTFVDPSPIENVRYATDLYRALAPLRKTWTGLATTRLVRHPELMDAMAEGKACGSCHNGQKAFATMDGDKCFSCHKPS